MDDRTKQSALTDALPDGLRRTVLAAVVRSPAPMRRDDVAALLDIPRSTATFHLEKLVKDGLLATESQNSAARAAGVVGRPSKLYRQSATEYSLSIPERRYELVGDMLSSALEEAERSGGSPLESLERVSTRMGHRLGEAASSLDEAMLDCGYDPIDDGAGGVILTNCPFRKLASLHRELICTANLALVRGIAETAGADGRRIELAPHETHCCVRIVVG